MQTLTGAEIVARCSTVWGVRTVMYDMGSTATPTGHRADCSGYASAVLGLPAPGETTVTLVTDGFVTLIGWNQLEPGDLIMIGGPGTEGADGHVVIYTGQESGGFGVWEQSGGQYGPHHSIWHDPASQGYEPYRYAAKAPSTVEEPVSTVAHLWKDTSGQFWYVTGPLQVKRRVTEDEAKTIQYYATYNAGFGLEDRSATATDPAVIPGVEIPWTGGNDSVPAHTHSISGTTGAAE